MKKADLWRMTGLEAAALLLGLTAAGLLMYLCPEPADLRACVWAAPLLMGGGGGFYLGGKTSPRWFRAAVIAAVAGLALIVALLASTEPRLLTAGTLLRAGTLLIGAALLGSLVGAGRREARRLPPPDGPASKTLDISR